MNKLNDSSIITKITKVIELQLGDLWIQNPCIQNQNIGSCTHELEDIINYHIIQIWNGNFFIVSNLLTGNNITWSNKFRIAVSISSSKYNIYIDNSTASDPLTYASQAVSYDDMYKNGYIYDINRNKVYVYYILNAEPIDLIVENYTT